MGQDVKPAKATDRNFSVSSGRLNDSDSFAASRAVNKTFSDGGMSLNTSRGQEQVCQPGRRPDGGPIATHRQSQLRTEDRAPEAILSERNISGRAHSWAQAGWEMVHGPSANFT